MADKGIDTYPSRLLRVLVAVSIFQGYASAVPAQVIDDAGRTFGLSRPDLAPAILLITIGSVGALFIAAAADRTGRKPVLVASIVISAALTSLTGLAGGLGVFTALAMLARIFVIASAAIALTMMAEESLPGRRGISIGILGAAGGVGLALAFWAESIWGGDGWRLVAFTAILGLIPGAWARSLRETPRWERPESQPARSRRLLGNQSRQLIQLGLVFMLAFFAFFAAAAWWGPFAEHEAGLGSSARATSISTAYALGLLGYLFGGWYSDRRGRRRAGGFLLIGAGLSGAGVFAVSDPFLQLPLLTLATFFALAAIPVMSAMSVELFPTRIRATSAALMRGVFATFGGVLGPLLVGFLADDRLDIVGSISGSVLWTSLAIIPAAILIRLLPESSGRSLEDIEASGAIPAEQETGWDDTPEPARLVPAQGPSQAGVRPLQTPPSSTPAEAHSEPEPDQVSPVPEPRAPRAPAPVPEPRVPDPIPEPPAPTLASPEKAEPTVEFTSASEFRYWRLPDGRVSREAISRKPYRLERWDRTARKWVEDVNLFRFVTGAEGDLRELTEDEANRHIVGHGAWVSESPSETNPESETDF